MRLSKANGSLWKRPIIACVALLSGVAILAAVIRIASITAALGVTPADRPEWTPADRMLVATSTKLLGIEPGTARYAEFVSETRRVVNKFIAHPGNGLLHLLLGIVFVLLAPFQFSARIRQQKPRLHRWSGRVLVTIAVVIGVTGMFLGVIVPTYGLIEAVTISIIGCFFLYCIVRAVVEIRRRNVALHREWMIRAFAAALAVGMVRIVSVPLITLLIDPKTSVLSSFWVGWLSTLAGAELCIRHTRTSERALQLSQERAWLELRRATHRGNADHERGENQDRFGGKQHGDVAVPDVV